MDIVTTGNCDDIMADQFNELYTTCRTGNDYVAIAGLLLCWRDVDPEWEAGMNKEFPDRWIFLTGKLVWSPWELLEIEY